MNQQRQTIIQQGCPSNHGGNSYYHDNHYGITLVELLVVLAILALLAAVAIPAFAKHGFFSGNELQSSSRELYSLLNAAKVHAATYRVNTAVVYADPENTGCLQAVTLAEKANNEDVYIPLNQAEGGFRRLPGDTGISSNVNDKESDTSRGFSEITVRFPATDEEFTFKANVFEPSGRLMNASQELYTLNICFSPQTAEIERLDASGEIRVIPIELHRSTGRARIATQ